MASKGPTVDNASAATPVPRVSKIWAGSNEIMKELIGRDLGLRPLTRHHVTRPHRTVDRLTGILETVGLSRRSTRGRTKTTTPLGSRAIW